MALTKAPLFSLSASGQISKTLTFRAMRRNKVVSAFVSPSQPSTLSQKSQNVSFGLALDRWRDELLTDLSREAYRHQAVRLGKSLPPYQLWMHQYGSVDPAQSSEIAYKCKALDEVTFIRLRLRYFNITGSIAYPSLPWVWFYYGKSLTGPWQRKRIQLTSIGKATWDIPIDTAFPLWLFTTTDNGAWNSGTWKFQMPI